MESHSANKQLQFSDTSFYNTLDACFSRCVNNFSSKELIAGETVCLENCFQKYTKTREYTHEQYIKFAWDTINDALKDTKSDE